MAKIPVLLSRCEGYQSSRLYQVIDQQARALSLEKRCRGSKVLLKPNLITYKAPSFACTRAEFIVEVVRWFLDHGAQVSVGDSPAYGSARGVMRHHGILKKLAPLPVEIVEFAKTRSIELSDGTKIRVAEAAYEFDLLINLPKLKAHNQMYVTLALKNLFGFVKGHKKALLHISHGESQEVFSKMLLELIDVLPQVTTFVDGVEVMHKAGPIKGQALRVNCIAASDNPVALDRALIEVLELDSKRSPILAEAEEQGRFGSKLEDCLFPLLSPIDFAGSGFQAPDQLKPITFHPLKLSLSLMKRAFMRFKP